MALDTLCQFQCESGDVTQPAMISCTSSGQLEAGVPQCRGNNQFVMDICDSRGVDNLAHLAKSQTRTAMIGPKLY